MSTIRDYVGIVKGIFRWGSKHRLVPPGTSANLDQLDTMESGEAKARKIVGPADDERIAAILPYLSTPVAGIVRFIRHTGARPSEVMKLRPVDLQGFGTSSCFIDLGTDHKTGKHGIRRFIYVTPEAQDAVRPFMANRAVTDHLFKPIESLLEHRKRWATKGKPRRPDQTSPPKKTKRIVREHYDACSLRTAIVRAAEKAGVDPFNPYELRHAFLTEARQLHGLDFAQACAGHRHASTTERYAKVDPMTVFAKVMKSVG